MIKIQQTMLQTTSLPIVSRIMADFARSTGLSPIRKSPRRYLWTDAFAVCNFLELYRRTKEERYKELALELVGQVHNILGRHRKDDPRQGWISGLSEEEGRKHPTRGGLRIGKKLNERKPGERSDDRLEWDQDGQYFHYLTKWMHALNMVTRVTGDFTCNRWATELAKAVHGAFLYVHPHSYREQMYWKMSIDLMYPLVRSMGHHDPLDGLITYSQLQATRNSDPDRECIPDLTAEILDMTAICKGSDWATDDPLGMGGLLSDSYRVAQLAVADKFEQTDLVGDLLDASLLGLQSYRKGNSFELPASYRLAFRELGLVIGLSAVPRMERLIRRNREIFLIEHGFERRFAALGSYLSIGSAIEAFWLERKNQESRTWTEHRDINMVMMSTSLAPDGFLTFRDLPGSPFE